MNNIATRAAIERTKMRGSIAGVLRASLLGIRCKKFELK
jgi:hypothetical protein